MDQEPRARIVDGDVALQTEGQLIGKLKPRPSVAGRAQIISRDRGVLSAQLAFSPPREG